MTLLLTSPSLTTLSLTSLLAETHLAEVSLQYRAENHTDGASAWWFLAIPVLAVAIAGIIYHFFNRPPAIVNTPLGMLHELCKVHRIGRRGRLTLESVARSTAAEHPAVLFANEGQFNTMVEAARAKGSWNKSQDATVGILRRKMFA